MDATLDLADVGAVDLGLRREHRLRPAARQPVLTQHLAELATDQILTNERRGRHSPHGTIPSVLLWSG